MFGPFTGLAFKYGGRLLKKDEEQQPQSFASQPMQQQPMQSSIPQQAMMSYAPEVDNRSKLFPSLSVEQEQSLMKQYKGDISKIDSLMPKIIQAQQDAYFLEDRRLQTSKMVEAASKETDKTKRQNMLIVVKQAQLADAVRKQAMLDGRTGGANIKDEDIINGITKLNPEISKKQLPKYLEGSIDADLFLTQLQTGNTLLEKKNTIAGGSFLAQSAEDISNRFSGMLQSFGDLSVKDIFTQRPLLRGAGALAGMANDVIGNAINSILQRTGADEKIGNVIKSITDTEIGQRGIELYQQGAEAFSKFEEVHPKTAQDIKDLWELAQFAPIPALGATKPGQAVGKAVGETIESGVKAITPEGSITEGIAKRITGTVADEDKLFKAASPTLNKLSKNRNLETLKSDFSAADNAIVEYGFKPVDTTTRREAHEKVMESVWKEIDTRIQNKADYMVDTKQFATLIDDAVAQAKKLGITENAGDIKALEAQSKAFKKLQSVDLPTMEKQKQMINGIINNWGDSRVGDLYKNTLKQVTRAMGTVEDGVLAKIPGEFGALKKKFGALKATYEDVLKADIKAQKAKGLGLAETYSRIEGVGDILGGAFSILTRGSAGIADVAKGVGKVTLGKALQTAKDADFLIKEGFEGLSKKITPKNVEIPASVIETPQVETPTSQVDFSTADLPATPKAVKTPKKVAKKEKMTTIEDTLDSSKKDMQDLYEEARKYKSAEEFVNKNNTKKSNVNVLSNDGNNKDSLILYHGTDADFQSFDKSYFGKGEGSNKLGKGVYLTTNKSKALEYGNKVINVTTDGLNIIDRDAIKHQNTFQDFISNKKIRTQHELNRSTGGDKGMDWKEAFARKGFDGIKYADGEIIVFDTNKLSINSDSQLRKIWEEANK